jgi:transcriptional/translational regulatory protein YebC/TACO1
VLDDTTQYELAKLAANLEALYPSDKLSKQYPFSGEESISYAEAMKLMEMLQKMDKLEELDDVQRVFINADFPDKALETYRSQG